MLDRRAEAGFTCSVGDSQSLAGIACCCCCCGCGSGWSGAQSLLLLLLASQEEMEQEDGDDERTESVTGLGIIETSWQPSSVAAATASTTVFMLCRTACFFDDKERM